MSMGSEPRTSQAWSFRWLQLPRIVMQLPLVFSLKLCWRHHQIMVRNGNQLDMSWFEVVYYYHYVITRLFSQIYYDVYPYILLLFIVYMSHHVSIVSILDHSNSWFAPFYTLIFVESYIYIYIYLVGGLEHKCYSSIYWEFHHPNWRTPSFFRGVGIPPTSIYIYIWVKYIDLTVLPHWNHGFYREIIPFYGLKIQVSEIL